MAGIPRKRPAVVKKNYGPYKKLNQIRGDGRWIPTALAAVTTSPALASKLEGPKAHRPLRYGKYDRRLKGFSFRITRDDGEVMGLEDVLSINIYKKIKAGTQWVAETIRYSEDTAQYWSFENGVWILESELYDLHCKFNPENNIWTVPYKLAYRNRNMSGKRFWVSYTVRDSVSAQYSPTTTTPQGTVGYLYIDVTKRKDEDLIAPKFYEARAPKFKEVRYAANNLPELPDQYPYNIDPLPSHWTGTTAWRGVTVESSIQYTVRMRNGAPVGPSGGLAVPWHAYGVGNYVTEYYKTVEEVIQEAVEAGPGWISWTMVYYWPETPTPQSVDDMVNTSTTHGESSTSPIDVTFVVTPAPFTVEAESHRITCTWIGGEFLVSAVCQDGTADFPVEMKILQQYFSAAAKAKID